MGTAANITGERTGMSSGQSIEIHTEESTYVLQGKQVLKRLEWNALLILGQTPYDYTLI